MRTKKFGDSAHFPLNLQERTLKTNLSELIQVVLGNNRTKKKTFELTKKCVQKDECTFCVFKSVLFIDNIYVFLLDKCENFANIILWIFL